MKVDVALLPTLIAVESLPSKNVVVFDVLRATTSMTAALSAGITEIRIFDTLDAASTAAKAHPGKRLLCGETKCLTPPGFDLGNSPRAFQSIQHAGQTMFLSTTNGTRAIVASRGARRLLVGAIVNAAAVARELASDASDVLLVCAGTNGEIAWEDALGAGAVIQELSTIASVELESDSARMSQALFRNASSDLVAVLRDCRGGRNVIAAGLSEDIDFAARLNVFNRVGVVEDHPLRAV